MYFPKDFNNALALELGSLIVQAYAQFNAFELDKPWRLPEAYTCLGEVTYALNSGGAPEKQNFDFPRFPVPGFKANRDRKIPIGFIARRKGTLFLIFRGTRTVKEWTRNLTFNLKDYLLPGHGMVHEGFLQTYRSMRDTMLGPLLKEGPKGKLYVAGHSLGGALATLAVPDIEANAGLKVGALYTFGAPRVGDDAYVSSFNRSFSRRSFRVVNTSDLVPSVPLPIPLGIKFGGYFSHVDTPVDFTVQREDIDKNHEMEMYLSALRAAEKRGPFPFLRAK